MDDHRQLGDGVLNGGHQVVGLLGAHDAGHVLDADGLDAHLLQVLHHLDVLLQGVDGAGGEADGAGGVSAPLDRLIHGDLQVAHIVQGVENTDDVNAVLDGVLHELAHHVVGVVLIAQDVLAAQQHLQLGVGHLLANLPQPLPGVLLQVAQADVEGGSTPDLGGIVAGLVDGLQNGLKFAVGQAGSDQGLVRVAQDGFGKTYFSSLAHVFSTSKLLPGGFPGAARLVRRG